MFDLLPVGIYVCDSDGRVVDYNRAAAELWGHAPERGSPAVRFCGSYGLYALDGSPIPHDQCAMAAVLASGNARRDEEIVIQRHDGTRRTALVSIEPIRDGDGRLAGAVSVLRDNSAQRRNEMRYRAIFDNAQISFWEVDFSQVLDFLGVLRAAGVTDLRAHLAAHPESLREAIGRLRVTGVNRFTRELFEAPDDEPPPKLLAGILVPEPDRLLIEELVALWERPGQRRVGKGGVSTCRCRWATH